MYKAKELRDESLEELEVRHKDACLKLFELNNALRADKKQEASQERKRVRKGIARLLTIMTEKRAFT